MNEEKIPEGWVETTLGKVTTIESGSTPSTKNELFWGGNIPWISPKDLSNHITTFISRGERNITELGLKNSSAKLLPKNTILFSSRAPIGYIAIAENEVTTNQGFKNVICNEINSHFKYFYFLLKYKTDYIEKQSSGSTFSEVSASLLKSIKIKVPPINEQQSIAHILTSFDDKIELLQAQNKTLEILAQTIFKERFGKYQIGDKLPEGWRLQRISNLFEVRDGTHDSPKKTDIGMPLITSRHIRNNNLDFENAYLISEKDFNDINKRSLVERYDILYSMIGTLGLTYLEQADNINYAIKNVALFKTSKNTQWIYYTYLWLTSNQGKDFIKNFKSGSTQEYISLGSLRNILFIEPKKDVLVEFNNLIKTFFDKVYMNIKQIQTLTTTRDALLPKLMSGEIRVKI